MSPEMECQRRLPGNWSSLPFGVVVDADMYGLGCSIGSVEDVAANLAGLDVEQQGDPSLSVQERKQAQKHDERLFAEQPHD